MMTTVSTLISFPPLPLPHSNPPLAYQQSSFLETYAQPASGAYQIVFNIGTCEWTGPWSPWSPRVDWGGEGGGEEREGEEDGGEGGGEVHRGGICIAC
jgi:hypothetical protein